MNRKAVSGLMLMLLLVSMPAFILHPVHATPTPRSPETPVEGEPLHRQPGLTSHAPEWNKTYGGTDFDLAYSVVEAGDGGYAIAGETASFGAGYTDFWLVKTDADGNMEWNQTYGGMNWDAAYSVVETGDGGYALTGYTYSFGAGYEDFWLVKTDADGNMEWNQTYGGTDYDRAYSVVEAGDGGYALAGSSYSFGAGGSDFWLVKTDADGNMEWTQTYGGTNGDYADCVVETGDGGYAIAGHTSSFGAGKDDFWLVKTDVGGNVEWNQTYGGTDYDSAHCVVETGDGGYALAGSSYSFGAGSYDFWLVKTDADGNMEWNQTYGGTDSDAAWSVVETGDGGYALAGSSYSFGAGGSDFWLVKTDADGNMEWNQTYGGTDRDTAWSVVETGDGGYALAGSTWSFGAGSYDFWLVKIKGLEPEETMVFFNVNPNPTTPGQTITLKGVLIDECTSRLGDEIVELYAKPFGAPSWAYITSLTTDAYGIFKWQITVPWTTPANIYLFAVYYPGSAIYGSSYNFATLIIQ